MRAMELRQMTAALAVLRAGSFSAAARQLHLSQPALWAQVKALEEDLGVRLLRREGRGVVPTAAAVALRPAMESALAGVEAVETLARSIRDGRAAPARIGCAAYHVPHFLAGCIEEVARRHPGSPFPEIVPITSATGAELLARGAIDLAVMTPPDAGPSPRGALLYPARIVAVGPLVTGPTLEFAALHDAPLALMPPDSRVRVEVERVAAGTHTRLRVVHEDRTAATLLALARRGLCTAILISEALEPGDTAAVLTFDGTPFEAPLHLLWRDEAALSPAAQRLREVMLARAAAL